MYELLLIILNVEFSQKEHSKILYNAPLIPVCVVAFFFICTKRNWKSRPMYNK